jgi:hypothetical protein
MTFTDTPIHQQRLPALLPCDANCKGEPIEFLQSPNRQQSPEFRRLCLGTWGHNLVALATMLSGKRSDFKLSTPLGLQRIFDKSPLMLRSGLALYDPFFFEFRYSQELNKLESIGPDDVIVLDALVRVLTPFC